jgi:hypothetical protein
MNDSIMEQIRKNRMAKARGLNADDLDAVKLATTSTKTADIVSKSQASPKSFPPTTSALKVCVLTLYVWNTMLFE